MSQCLNVSCLAACLRERAARARTQPSYRKLARAARLGETHPGIRSPVARLKIRISAPQRPRLPQRRLNATQSGSTRENCVEGQSAQVCILPLDGRRRCGAAAGGVAQALALALLAAAGLARLSHGTCAVGFARRGSYGRTVSRAATQEVAAETLRYS